MRRLLFGGFFFALSFAAIKPLLSAGFFTIHDYQQVARLFELNKSLLAGQFPVRWVQDLGFGFGYPLFNFYPPLVYYLGELFHLLLRLSFLDSTKLVWGLALLGSAVAMYFLAREFFGRLAGLVAAMFYLYAPYHAVDAYVRGALAELFSFVWLPLILLLSYKTIKTNKIGLAVLMGILLALLMLTHNLVFLPFFGLFALWYFSLTLIYSRKKILPHVLHFLLSTFVAFALTTFFWLPALAEKQFTLTDQFLTTGLASYRIHFVCPGQLWSSPWGFGGSVPGCLDGISFAIGKVHIFSSLFAIFFAAALYFRKKIEKSIFYLLSSIFFLFVVSAFMTLEYAKPIWDLVQPLWYLQFPWRFLEFVVLFSSLLAGAVIYLLPRQKFKISVGVILVGLLLVVEAKYFQPQYFETKASDASLLNDSEIKWRVSATSFEYMTKGVSLTRQESGAPLLDISPAEVGEPGYKLNFGGLRTDSFNFQSDRIFWVFDSGSGANITLPVNNFPGWVAHLDGKPLPIDDRNPLKLITLNLPSGHHSLLVQFENTPVRNVGNIISLLAILALPAFFYGTRRSQT